jgi:hypothetical protein
MSLANLIVAVLGLLLATIIVVGITTRALGGNLALVEDWKKSATWLSMAAWGVVFSIPSLWNEAVALGVLETADAVSPEFAWVVRALSTIGALSRLVSQKKGILPAKPTFGAG